MTTHSTILALEQQVGCYRLLAKLAERQHEHVQNNQTDAAGLERLISPARRHWHEFSQGLGEGDRLRAEELLGEVKLLLEQITQADQHDALVLQQRKLNLGRQINQASAAVKVNRSYATAAYGPPTARVDVRGM
jgi:tRNA nucleotidyltransferase/poly(A) polymerase